MKIDTFFDKGYYINLDSRPDRDIQIREELTNMGLLSFFERHTAFSPPLDDVNSNDRDEICARRMGSCAQSHKDVIKKAVELNLNNVLIFEDDTTLYHDGPKPAIEIIESGLNTLSTLEDWDIVYIGGIIIDPEVKKVGENLIKVNKMLSSHAWGINKKMFGHFLNFEPYIGPDSEPSGAMDAAFGNDTRLNKYLIYPLAMYQRFGTRSDINHNPEANVNEIYEKGIVPWINNYNNITFV